MGTDWKEVIPPVTTERENILRDDATVCSASNRKMQKSAEMTDSAKAVTIGHQTVTLPPATGLNTQRIRYTDSVPAIQ